MGASFMRVRSLVVDFSQPLLSLLRQGFRKHGYDVVFDWIVLCTVSNEYHYMFLPLIETEPAGAVRIRSIPCLLIEASFTKRGQNEEHQTRKSDPRLA